VRTRGVVRRFNLAKSSPKNSRDFLTADCGIITILKPITPMHDLIQLQPYDQLNRELEANVHPPDWINPKPSGRYNLVVIGAGTAGLVAAAGAAGLGAKVALIERELLGGDCLNVGCVPSKALLSAAKRVAAVRRAGEFGINVPEGVDVDFAAVMERMRRLRAGISPHDSASRFRDLGIDVFFGQGKLTAADRIEVAGERLTFSRAVVATGSRAAAPAIPGLNEVEYLTNESVFSLTKLPKCFAVIGAGPIGCEMAQAFARFGSQVILVESGKGLLPKEDTDASKTILEALKRNLCSFDPEARN
jgi:pyruvate/2-oxoglutarate dehydrogenase complex dihydrolipoamide dehydrogenase (E3) component